MRAGFAGLLLLSTLLVGCESGPSIVGSGTIKSEKRNVGAFTAITADGSFKIDVTAGEATEVTVEADDNILPLIETKVEQNALVIRSNESYRSNHGIKITVKTPQLSGVVVNGSGEVTMRGVASDSLKLAINGSASMNATGKTQDLDAQISGSGDLKLADLAANKARVAISGSGSANVDASTSLDVVISGSGDVRYKDHPGITVNKTVAGSGSVKQVN